MSDYEFRDINLHDEPVYRIIVSVLRQAVEDAVRQPSKNAAYDAVRRLSDNKADAIAWLMSGDRGILSAIWCCELIGLDLADIRTRVMFEAPELAAHMKWARKKQVGGISPSRSSV